MASGQHESCEACGVEQALTGDEPVLPAIAADELTESAASTYEDADPDAVATELISQHHITDVRRGLSLLRAKS